MPIIDQTQGILGTEARFLWRGLTLNDKEASLPKTICRAVRGLYSARDSDNITDKKSSNPGEVLFPSFSRGKTLSYEFTLYAADLPSLRAEIDVIRSAFVVDLSNAYPMIHQPHPSLGTQEWGYDARVTAFDMDEVDPTSEDDAISEYQIGFSVALRNFDGRYYDPAYQGFGPFAEGTTQVIPVTGRAETEPIITGSIPAGGPFPASIIITNHSVTIPWYLGYPDPPKLEFDASEAGFLGMPDGDYLFNLETGELLATPTSSAPFDMWRYVQQFQSTWTLEGVPGLIPGNNSIEVNGLSDWSIAFRNRLP